MFRVVNDFYSHFFDTDEGVTVAKFQTKTDTIYRAYFYPMSDYFDILEPDSKIYQNGFFFGFTKVGENEDKNESPDMKIRNTIINIISEFFEKSADSILIFQCDKQDKKHLKRSKTFEEWFTCADTSHCFKKYNEELIIASIDPTIPDDKEYLSLIIKCDNPNTNIALEEFQEIKELFISNKQSL